MFDSPTSNSSPSSPLTVKRKKKSTGGSILVTCNTDTIILWCWDFDMNAEVSAEVDKNRHVSEQKPLSFRSDDSQRLKLHNESKNGDYFTGFYDLLSQFGALFQHPDYSQTYQTINCLTCFVFLTEFVN